MRLITALIITGTLVLFPINSVYATDTNPRGVGTVTVPVGIDTSPDAVFKFIPTVMQIAFFFGLIATFVYLVYGGIRWIMSGGDQKALMAARETIVQAVVGVLMLSVAFAVAVLLNSLVKPSAPNSPNTNGAACRPSNPGDCRGCRLGCALSDDGINYTCQQCGGPE